MNGLIYEKMILFRDKIKIYKGLVASKLSVLDVPSSNVELGNLNDELLELFYELKEYIYSEGNLKYKQLHNEYKGNLGNIYDVALSNNIKHNIIESLDMVYRDLQEIIIKNNQIPKNDIVYKSILDDNQLSDNEKIRKTIDHSSEKFFDKNSTNEDKRDAVKAIADCLEYYRESLKKIKFLRDDEADIFNIINNFGIRHLNKKQKIEYDEDIFYEWMFTTFYNTLKVFLKILERDKRDK